MFPLSDPSRTDVQQSPPPSVYVWFCCEGWLRFGPFEWLRFDDDFERIYDERGAPVAEREGRCWRVLHPDGRGLLFSNPTITSTKKHPHMNSGGHPNLR